jgi:hypothetical protein
MSLNADQVASMLEIQQLRSAYTWCLDTPNIDGLVDLFTDDAHCKFGPYGSWDGKEQLRAGFLENSSAASDPFLTMHVTVNHRIELEGRDRATGQCYLLGQILSQREGPDGILGRYDDVYRKVGGRWLFAEIRLSFPLVIRPRPSRRRDGREAAVLCRGTRRRGVGTELTISQSTKRRITWPPQRR